MKQLLVIIGLSTCLTSQAQENSLLQQYRNQVIQYNQDIKSAGYAVSMKKEMEHAAKADFLPQLSGQGNFRYTGHPNELSVTLPETELPLEFQGKNLKYGAGVAVAQPIYSGGALQAGYNKARRESEISQYEKDRLINNVIYDADVCYWNKVAREELVKVASDYQHSVSRLVEVVRHRTEEKYTDRNDLLMAEVKLNDATYRLTQAQNEAETARLSLNSFSGVSFTDTIPTDSEVTPLRENEMPHLSAEEGMAARPELKISYGEVEVQKESARIANAGYLPQLSIGAEGTYSSPGYNFRADMDPNYAVYAKLSIPIFEWGKRKNTRRAGKYRVNMAKENHYKTSDYIRLEIETAYYTYEQAIQKVKLTESSLQKAAQSETLAMDKYKEGNLSIVEVLNAQMYHQEARTNYIQSKLNAQIAKSSLERAIGKNR